MPSATARRDRRSRPAARRAAPARSQATCRFASAASASSASAGSGCSIRCTLQLLEGQYEGANLALIPRFGLASRPYAGTLAVNSIPSAFITAIVVFNVGLPCSLSDR